MKVSQVAEQLAATALALAHVVAVAKGNDTVLHTHVIAGHALGVLALAHNQRYAGSPLRRAEKKRKEEKRREEKRREEKGRRRRKKERNEDSVGSEKGRRGK